MNFENILMKKFLKMSKFELPKFWRKAEFRKMESSQKKKFKKSARKSASLKFSKAKILKKKLQAKNLRAISKLKSFQKNFIATGKIRWLLVFWRELLDISKLTQLLFDWRLFC